MNTDVDVVMREVAMVLECRRILWNATVSLQGTCWAIMFDGRPLPLRRNRSNVGGTQNSLLAKAKQIQREVVRMDDQTVLALQLEGYQSESVYLARGFDSISPCYYYISVGHVWQRTDNWMTQQGTFLSTMAEIYEKGVKTNLSETWYSGISNFHTQDN